MVNESSIRIRIDLLESRKRDNGNIIKKLKRKLRRVQKAAK